MVTSASLLNRCREIECSPWWHSNKLITPFPEMCSEGPGEAFEEKVAEEEVCLGQYSRLHCILRLIHCPRQAAGLVRPDIAHTQRLCEKKLRPLRRQPVGCLHTARGLVVVLRSEGGRLARAMAVSCRWKRVLLDDRQRCLTSCSRVLYDIPT